LSFHLISRISFCPLHRSVVLHHAVILTHTSVISAVLVLEEQAVSLQWTLCWTWQRVRV